LSPACRAGLSGLKFRSLISHLLTPKDVFNIVRITNGIVL
jgi:hypothetical protein